MEGCASGVQSLQTKLYCSYTGRACPLVVRNFTADSFSVSIIRVARLSAASACVTASPKSRFHIPRGGGADLAMVSLLPFPDDLLLRLQLRFHLIRNKLGCTPREKTVGAPSCDWTGVAPPKGPSMTHKSEHRREPLNSIIGPLWWPRGGEGQTL